MAVLTDSERRDVWKTFQQRLGARRRVLAFTKAQLRTAIDGVDVWVEDNAQSGTQSMTAVVTDELTLKEQIELISLVFLRRKERA